MRAFIVVIAGMVLSGCATVLSGNKSEALIQTEPPGARVYVNGEYRGDAPVSVNLSRRRDYTVVAKMDGFRPMNARLERSFNTLAIGNLACLACWAVDAGTGAMWQFEKDSLTIELKPDPNVRIEPVVLAAPVEPRRAKSRTFPR